MRLRPLSVALALAILSLVACSGGPPPGGEPTDIAAYPEVAGHPAVELSDGSVFLLQRLDAWQALIEQFPAADVTAESTVLGPTALPPSVDLRANQTPIRNQGGRNTCVAFATVAGIEAAYRRLEGSTFDLSEQYANHVQKATALPQTLAPLPARETQLGAWGGSGVGYQLGWLFRLRFGIPLETDLPYVSTGDYEDTNQPGDVPRLMWNDTSYSQQLVDTWNLEDDVRTYQIPAALTVANLPRDVLVSATYGVSEVRAISTISLESLKSALAEGREVVFGVALTRPAAGEVAFEGGVWMPASEEWGGHAMVMVGYDDAAGAFLVKNSWGREAGTGRGQPAAADLDADGFIKMDYGWVSRIYEAFTIHSVRDVSTWENQQPFLGDWTVEADYTHLANINGQLAIYHLPGAFPSSALSGATDRRLGTLYADGDLRVNGSTSVGSGLLSANFAPLSGVGTYDFMDGQYTISAYLFEHQPTMMAGWSSFAGATVPFYANLDGFISGTAADTSSSVDATDYLGAWRFIDDGLEGVLRLSSVDAGGTVRGRFEAGGTVVTGVTGTLDGSNPCRVLIEIPHADGSRSYDGGLFCTDRAPERSVIAGTSTPSGSSFPVDGFLAIRTGSSLYVVITSPSDGGSYPRGSVNIPLEADVVGATSVSWTSDVDGAIGSGASTAVNDLSVGTHVITVTAMDAEGSTATDSVTITVTNDPPVVDIVAPTGTAPFCVGESIAFSATVTDINEPPSYTLGDSAVAWRIVGGADMGIGKSIDYAFAAAGGYTVVVRATDPNGAFDEDSVNVAVEECAANQPPSVAITNPPADTGTSDFDFVYDGFDDDLGMWFKDVALVGSASDPEDGALSGGSLVWVTDRSDLQVAMLGTGTSVTPRLYSDVCTGTWHEVTLTATDSDGASRSAIRRIFIWTLC